MNRIQKHSFEAVSLLTAENGLLDISIIPANNQPDWVIPTDLILSIDDYHERIWTYLWHNQEVSVYHLLPKDAQPEKLVVLEGNTDVHRIALQIQGEITQKQVKISDVKDVQLPANYDYVETNPSAHSLPPTHQPTFSEPNTNLPYVFQSVLIDGVVYLVPDLDKVSHHLVDLDG